MSFTRPYAASPPVRRTPSARVFSLSCPSLQGALVKASLPACESASSCLLFQIGETTQVHSAGALQATPHAVRSTSQQGKHEKQRPQNEIARCQRTPAVYYPGCRLYVMGPSTKSAFSTKTRNISRMIVCMTKEHVQYYSYLVGPFTGQ